MLYEKHKYLNKDVDFLVNKEINEYDISSAGFNLCKKYNILPDNIIDYMEGLDKKERQIFLGNYQLEYPELKDILNEKFIEIRKLFFEENSLKDDEILSIKKDAIVTLKTCHNLIFDNVTFKEKKYTSYYYINDNEFYLGSDFIDIKGISNNKLKNHKEYMIDFLFNIFKLIENNGNKDYIIDQLIKFSYFYKDKKLDIGYYRELNRDSLFKLNNDFIKNKIGVEYVKDVSNIDIRYNYIHYIVPILNIFL